MSIYFPSISSLARGIVLAVVLAVVGHIAFPALGLVGTAANTVFSIGYRGDYMNTTPFKQAFEANAKQGMIID